MLRCFKAMILAYVAVLRARQQHAQCKQDIEDYARATWRMTRQSTTHHSRVSRSCRLPCLPPKPTYDDSQEKKAMSERNSKPRVRKDEFEQRLHNAGLTKLRFAELTGMRRTNVVRWNASSAPAWTTSWLILYTRAPRAALNVLKAWADFVPPK